MTITHSTSTTAAQQAAVLQMAIARAAHPALDVDPAEISRALEGSGSIAALLGAAILNLTPRERATAIEIATAQAHVTTDGAVLRRTPKPAPVAAGWFTTPDLADTNTHIAHADSIRCDHCGQWVGIVTAEAGQLRWVRDYGISGEDVVTCSECEGF